MKYYKRLEIEEHMLYANEILEIFKDHLPKDFTPKKVHIVISRYCQKYNIEDPHYYYYGYGLKKVYPRELWYDAIVDYLMFGGRKDDGL